MDPRVLGLNAILTPEKKMIDTIQVSIPTAILGVVFAIGIATVALSYMKYARKDNLPPGPAGLPFIGNLADLPPPTEFEAHHWLKHKAKYGLISSLNVMGQPIVIVNDAHLALEMLEKRSVKYSLRPKFEFAGSMVGWENSLAFQQNDNRFRAIRKNMSRIIGSQTSAAHFNQMQEAEVGHFLLHVLDQPNNLVDHIKREAGSLILKIAYGYTTEPHEKDPLIEMAVDAMDKFGRSIAPGAFLVDIIPSLKHIPGWLPGAGFKQTAKQWRAELNETTELPYQFVKYQRAQGQKNTSFLSQLFEAGEPNSEVEYANRWSSMSLFLGGSDTTVSSIASFFLAMTICPTAQRKAQEEIDRVVGSKRLPSFSDRPNLPYVDAIVKEVLRWAPVAPMGLPHVVSEDDKVGGYLIPKGAMILPNIWHFLHDERFYRDPMTFNPDRFIKTNDHDPEPDPHTYAFGFGRRICPGRILADNALFLNFAQCLAVLDIKKVVRNGREIDPVVKFEPGAICRPAPFENVIKPRSPAHERMIRSIEDQYPWQSSDSNVLRGIEEKEKS